MSHTTILIGVFVGLLAVSVGSIVVFRSYWQSASKLRDAAMNVLLMGCTFAYAFFALEVYFYQFGVQSKGFGVAMATKRFIAMNFHWNALGYRDFEQTSADFEGKHKLVVVGDSFTAGNGIANQADRFSDQLAMHLGEDWRVGNIAKGGWDTVRELEELKGYPVKPDVAVLTYYLNDIQNAVESQGLKFLGEFPLPKGKMKSIVESSYLLNVTYWRFYRVRVQFLEVDFWKGLQEYYQDEKVWDIHAQELTDFATYCEDNDIDLYVMMFPNLLFIEESAPVTKKIANHFASLGVQSLDLTTVLLGREPTDIVVNALDAHPNEGVHHEAGKLLYEFLGAEGALTR